MEQDLRSQIERLEQSKSLSPELKEQFEHAYREIGQSVITEKVPKAGAEAPDFVLPNAVGTPVALADALSRGPAVVTFYRGIWWPYCSLQLRAYQKILPEIMNRGASLMAISPQSPDKSQATLLKNFLEYEVLSDQGNAVARRYGLVYQLPEWVRDLYLSLGVNLPEFNADQSWELPMPGTFVIGPDRKIIVSYADSDPRNRLEPQAILDALKQ